MTIRGCGPVGAGHTNGAPQIRSAALGMTNKESVVVRKGRLLKERAVAKGKGRLLKERAILKPRHFKNLVWTRLKFSRPCGTHFASCYKART